MSFGKLNSRFKYINSDQIIPIVTSRSISFRINEEIISLLNYDFQKKLQPSEELQYNWKSGFINEEEYTKRYLKEHPDLKKTVKELKDLEKTSNKEIVLLCHCIIDKFCHNVIILQISASD